MSLLASLRILKRLTAVEAATRDLAAADETHAQQTTKDIADALAIHEGKSRPCARCGAMLDITVGRDDGPRIMEATKKVNGSPQVARIVACAWCEAAAKRLGWKAVKVAPVAAQEEAKS